MIIKISLKSLDNFVHASAKQAEHTARQTLITLCALHRNAQEPQAPSDALLSVYGSFRAIIHYSIQELRKVEVAYYKAART